MIKSRFVLFMSEGESICSRASILFCSAKASSKCTPCFAALRYISTKQSQPCEQKGERWPRLAIPCRIGGSIVISHREEFVRVFRRRRRLYHVQTIAWPDHRLAYDASSHARPASKNRAPGDEVRGSARPTLPAMDRVAGSAGDFHQLA